MARTGEVQSHWHLLIENFTTSTLEFYSRVEAAIAERQLPDVSTERIDWSEGGLGSDKRQYLRVKRGRVTFDICGAQFGTGHFFSWWLAEQTFGSGPAIGCLWGLGFLVLLAILISSTGLVLGTVIFSAIVVGLFVSMRDSLADGAVRVDDFIASIPIVGLVYSRFFMQQTYYRMDTRLMFQQSVHRVVASIVEDLNSAQGLRALRPEELQPMSRSMLQ